MTPYGPKMVILFQAKVLLRFGIRIQFQWFPTNVRSPEQLFPTAIVKTFGFKQRNFTGRVSVRCVGGASLGAPRAGLPLEGGGGAPSAPPTRRPPGVRADAAAGSGER